MTSKTKALNFASLAKENGWTGTFETDEENDYAKIIAKRKDEELEIEWVNNQLAAPPKYRFAGTEANLHSAAVAKRHITGMPDMRVAQMRRRRMQRNARKNQGLAGPRDRTENHEEKRRAYDLLRKAIDDGIVVRPEKCSECDSTERIQGHHHKGYSVECALDVVWLCQACHKKVHHGIGQPQQNSSNGAEVPLEVKQFELPFDLLESPNKEILLACRGSRVVYLNRITHMAEMVYIPKEKNRNWNKLHPVYYMTTASSGRRIINFIEDSGMFRAIALDTILQVR